MKVKSRICKLVAAATMMAAAIGFTAITAGSASAATAVSAQFSGYTTVCNSYGCLLDNGHGNIVTLDPDGGTLFYVEEYIYVDGYQDLVIYDGSDCLEPSPSNHYVYDESCPGDSSEVWLQYPNDALKNYYDGLNLTAPTADGYVYVGGGPANGSNEWSFGT